MLAVVKSDYDVALLAFMLFVTWAAAGFGSRIAKRLKIPAMVGEFFGGIMIGPTILGWLWPSAEAFLFSNEMFESYQHVIGLAILAFLLWLANEGHPDQFKSKPKLPLQLGIYSFAISALVGGLCYGLYFKFYPQNLRELSFSAHVLLMIGPMMSSPVIVSQIFHENGQRGEIVIDALFAALVSEFVGILALDALMNSESGLSGYSVLRTLLAILVLGLAVYFGPRLFQSVFRNMRMHLDEEAIVVRVKFFGFFLAAVCAFVGFKPAFGAYITGVLSGAIEPLRRKSVIFIQRITNLAVRPLFFGSLGASVDLRRDFSLSLVLFFVFMPLIVNFASAFLATFFSKVHKRDRLTLTLALTPTAVVFVVLLRSMSIDAQISKQIYMAAVIGVFAGTMIVSPLLRIVSRASLPTLTKEVIDRLRLLQTRHVIDKHYPGVPDLDDVVAALLLKAQPVGDAEPCPTSFLGDPNSVARKLTANIQRLDRPVAQFGCAILYCRDDSVQGSAPLILKGVSTRAINDDSGVSLTYPTHVVILLIFPSDTSEIFVSWIIGKLWERVLDKMNLQFRTQIAKGHVAEVNCVEIADSLQFTRKNSVSAENVSVIHF